MHNDSVDRKKNTKISLFARAKIKAANLLHRGEKSNAADILDKAITISPDRPVNSEYALLSQVARAQPPKADGALENRNGYDDIARVESNAHRTDRLDTRLGAVTAGRNQYDLLPSNDAVSRNQYDLLPSNDAVSRNQYDLLPSIDDISRNQYDLLPSNDDVSRNQYDLLPSNEDVERNRYDRLPANDIMEGPSLASNRAQYGNLSARVVDDREWTGPKSQYGPINGKVFVNSPSQDRTDSNKMPNPRREEPTHTNVAGADNKKAVENQLKTTFLPDARPRDIAAAGPRIVKPDASPANELRKMYLPPAKFQAKPASSAFNITKGANARDTGIKDTRAARPLQPDALNEVNSPRASENKNRSSVLNESAFNAVERSIAQIESKQIGIQKELDRKGLTQKK